jgi:hypothetical protein
MEILIYFKNNVLNVNFQCFYRIMNTLIQNLCRATHTDYGNFINKILIWQNIIYVCITPESSEHSQTNHFFQEFLL